MTRKLEDELGLPYLDELLKLERESKEQEELNKIHEAEEELQELRENDPTTAASFENALSKTQELEKNLADHIGLRQHDSEMDEVANEAMDAYRAFRDLSLNCSPAHTGKIAETAANMLRIALDARNAKSDKKLRMWRLQLDQARLLRDLERDKEPEEGVIENEEAIRMDRNKLLREIRGTLEDNNDWGK